MSKMHHATLVGVAALVLALGGCSLAPAHVQPYAPVPVQWKAADAAGASDAPTLAQLTGPSFVRDPQLRSILAQALENNRNLRQAVLNLDAVRAQYRVQRADRLPTVNAQLDGSRQRVPADLGEPQGPGVQAAWQAGLGVTAFELDLFGRLRSLSDAALEEYLASAQATRGVRITLVAEVIHAYLARDSALHRKLLTAQTLASREASLRLVAQRRRAGTATGLDYQEAFGLTQQARADLERIDRELRQAGNALELLVGADQLALPETPSTAPLLIQDLGAGTPSDLLVRRPDILAAEHRLRARNASIGAARAAFFPRIALTGLLGSSSPELSDLFSSGGRSWTFTPQLSLPIFDGGRNAANLDLATLRKDIAVVAYEETVQTAFREVSDALAAVDTLRREQAARSALADSSAQALRISEARWRAGVDDHLRYLDAQRSAFANRMASIQTSTEHQLALATLFKTLGGDWQAGAAP